MEDKHEYLLHTWGGFYNKEHKHGHKEGYFFFDSMKELMVYLKLLKDTETQYDAKSLVYDIEEGTHVRYRTVAKMKLKYGEKLYDFEYDFGYGYPVESAEYMFQEGNYACDCNRSIFLAAKYEVEEKDCGHEIQDFDFHVVLVRGTDEKVIYGD